MEALKFNDKSQDANPLGLNGMEFIEYSTPDPSALENLFLKLGFLKIGQHREKDVRLYRQNGIHFIINSEVNSFADEFRKAHGPSICATGFRVKSADTAHQTALKRGARDIKSNLGHTFPAIYGIGDSLIYFVENTAPRDIYARDFVLSPTANANDCALQRIDHMTNNVPVGQMDKWCSFYQKIFNFREVRYFDIQGQQTGLVSKVMVAPDDQICIPINEPKDGKSQIQEYLDEYKGSGIQHVALATDDICKSVAALRARGIEFLEVPDTYYEALPKRLPQITEDIQELKKHRILADGDHNGYLLQIFSKNLIGPIFFEVIQRKGHKGFGEGNFQALFDAIEEDQRRRGYL
jgi:4-hydroxyphenylpyruvate dioxygenase